MLSLPTGLLPSQLPVVAPAGSPWWLLGVGGVLAALTTYPYVATAIAYRHRDNGLAFILFVLGVGVWNAAFAAQLLSPDPRITEFFYGLSTVGASLGGLGWFLFASTASSTPRLARSNLAYAAAAVTVGASIVLAVTSPVHGLFWTLPPDPTPTTYAAVVPSLGYWLYTQMLVVLFVAGTLLFAVAWERGTNVRYARAYTIGGTVTVAAVVGSSVLSPGGVTVAPLSAVSLTTVGWVGASRGRVIARLRSVLRTSAP